MALLKISQKKIFVTGATGFVGKHLSRRLQKDGASLVECVRKSVVNKGSSKHCMLDLSEEFDVRNELKLVDVVVHLAARVHVMSEHCESPLDEFRKINVSGTLMLAKQAAESGVKKFIYISSVKVNGENSIPGEPFSAFSLPNPTDPYGVSKYEAELELLKLSKCCGMDVVIIRPPLVYGRGVKANFEKMIKLVKKGYPLPFGRVTKNKRSLVYVGNLVDLIVNVICNEQVTNEIFMVSDGKAVSTASLLNNVALALGVSSKLIRLPVSVLSICLTIMGKVDMKQRLLGSLEVDIQYTKETLNWVPPYSLEYGLEETVRKFCE